MGISSLAWSGISFVLRANVRSSELKAVTYRATPRMNGDQFAQAVLALRPNTPLLIITGYAAGLTRQNVRSLGAFDLLQKPITRQTLTTAVRRALDSSNKSQDDECSSCANIPARQI